MLELVRFLGEPLHQLQTRRIVQRIVQLQLVRQALGLLDVDGFGVVLALHQDDVFAVHQVRVVNHGQTFRGIFLVRLVPQERGHVDLAAVEMGDDELVALVPGKGEQKCRVFSTALEHLLELLLAENARDAVLLSMIALPNFHDLLLALVLDEVDFHDVVEFGFFLLKAGLQGRFG